MQDRVEDAIALAQYLSAFTTKITTETWNLALDHFTQASQSVKDTVVPAAQGAVESGTEALGQGITPIVENPLIKSLRRLPLLRGLFAAVGQVDTEQIQAKVAKLHRDYPGETPEQLAQRIMTEAAWKAAGVGFATNVVPPLALTLFALDLAAVTALQAEMVYHIAGVYGFSLQDPARRGEVLAIFGLSVGGSGLLKGAMSMVEVLPGIGVVVGTAGNAALLYTLGTAACQFYAAKASVPSG
ncbi:hypothetical protein GS597_09760 [Synechococcales cyanobacterium C]|uniref:EcsC family protein n=2 Tax=Petrachloros TaxID=2918834 RepID=A0A8K2A825_9CYAN|nr:hypothetical protein [Petrachloros mirabilis ULC683]